MGGDHGLRTTIPASLKCLAQFPQLELALVGDPDSIVRALAGRKADPRLTIIASDTVIGMDDKPSKVIREKNRSSLRVAIELLRDKQVDACISAGNTGAMMALGYHLLHTMPGIDRPAICTALPGNRGETYLLDLGANAQCNAKQLHQFALLGAALAATVKSAMPRVALLNIGEESIKGNDVVKEADLLMKTDDDLRYIGFIEGHQLLSGRADVVVCDGFSGNVALKVMEGTAAHVARLIKEQFAASFRNRILGLFARPVLKRMYAELDPQQYNGASLLGLNGVLVKCHGNSSEEGFCSAMVRTVRMVESDILARTGQKLSRLMN